MSIRVDSNIVEVVSVRVRPDIDPDEPLLGELWIWEHNGHVDYTFTPTNSSSTAGLETNN